MRNLVTWYKFAFAVERKRKAQPLYEQKSKTYATVMGRKRP